MTDRAIPASDLTSGLIMIAPPLTDSALDAILGGKRSFVVLVEPDPDRAQKLQARDGVRVICAAIGPEPGQRPMVRFNFPGLRSLFTPTATLRDALPGLRETGRTPVTVISPDDLAAQVEDLPDSAEMHIDAPGAEKMILQGLADRGVLARVSHLHLRCGTLPMVEGAAARSELEDWIRGQGFVLAADTSEDPDWSVLEFRADVVARALDEARAALKQSDQTAQRLQEQLTTLETERATRDKMIADLEAALTTVTKERNSARAQSEQRAKQITELESAGNAARQAATKTEQALAEAEKAREDSADALKAKAEALAKVTNERDTARAQSEQRAKRIADLEGSVNAARQATTKAERALDEAQKERDELVATLDARKTELGRVTNERDIARTQAEQRAKRISELESSVNQARQATEQTKADLGLALRMQMLAQADLRELQVRFAEVEQARSAQQTLLENLTPRLQQAARQLQQLQLADLPPAIEDAPRGRSLLAITQEKQKSKGKEKDSRKVGKKSSRK